MSWRSQQNQPLQSHNTHFHNFPELPNGEHQHLSRTHQEANHLLGGAVHHTTESFHHSLRTESVALVTQSAAVNHGAHQKSLRNVVLKECQCCPVLRHCAKPATAIYLPLKLPFLKRTDVMPRLRGDGCTFVRAANGRHLALAYNRTLLTHVVKNWFRTNCLVAKINGFRAGRCCMEFEASVHSSLT